MKAKELAKKLGVSPATISLVLNNKPGISETLRQTLIAKIKDLGCGSMLEHTSSPRQISAAQAATLDNIAYLIYTDCEETSNVYAFYPVVMEGAEMEARENGFQLVIFHMSRNGNPHLPALLKQADIIGAIVQTKNITDPILRDVKNLSIPCVFIDAYRPELAVSSVCVNNEQGMNRIVRCLKDNGHRKIGYVSSGKESESYVERRRNYHMALREYNLDDKQEYYYRASGEDEDACCNLVQLWKNKPILPTALVAENDYLAWRTIKALAKCGYQVPDDVSITGFDNHSICMMTEPRLTSVQNSRSLMGRECIQVILNMIRMQNLGFGHVQMKLELPVELVERESVKNIL